MAFNNLPKHWQIKHLGEVCQIIMGQSPPSTTYNSQGLGLPFFQGKAEFTDLHPLVEKWCNSPNKIAEKNDILLSVRAPVGKTNIADQKCCIGRGLAAIRYENFKYIFYFLRNIEQELDKKGTGTTFKAISGETIRTTKIPLPPFSEQLSIVSKIEELLSDLENGIQQLKIAQQQLKVYRQSLLKWAFEGRLTSLSERDKLSLSEVEAGKLPMGWKWLKLGDVCEKVETIKRKEENPEEEFLYMDIGGIDNNTNKIINYKTYKWKDAPSRAQQIVFSNDVLFSTVRTYLKNIAIIENLKLNGQIASSGFCVIRGKKKIINPKFIFYYSISPMFLQTLNELQTGSSYPAVRDKDVFYQQIPVPPLPEQNSIVDELESKLTVCDKIEETINQSLQQAETLRQSILKRAFEGKLVNLPYN